MPLITVTVKTLNGDLLQIQHDSLLGFNRFVDEVYKAFPDVPIGCLVLHRLLVDERSIYNCVLDELLDVDKVKAPCHIAPCHISHLSHVRDGDHVFATVDPSRVITRLNIHKNVYTSRDGINIRLHPFTINLYSKVIYDEKRKGHAHLGKVGVFFDKKNNLFALRNTFTPPSDIDIHMADDLGQLHPYYQTSQTRWLSLKECIELIPRFPQDEETRMSICKQIDNIYNFDEAKLRKLIGL